MKILHISKYYPPYRGGIEDICYSFVEFMKPFSEQEVLCFNKCNYTERSLHEEVQITRSSILGIIKSQPLSFSIFRHLKQKIKDFKPDIIHLHLPNPLICIYLLYLIPSKTKLILHWHSDIVEQNTIYKFIKPFESRILKRANSIIATSPNYIDSSAPLQKYKNKITIIPNIISKKKLELKSNEITLINDIKKKYDNKDIILFVGRHVQYKGLHLLMQAEKHIKSDCIILIAGEGPLTNQLKSNTKSNRIQFIGKIADNELKLYMNAASIFAFPSFTKNEAFGVALAEAMYCGAVPVCFKIEGSGVNWVNVHNVTGLEAQNANYIEFAKHIDFLITEKEIRNRYSKNAQKHINKNFTIESIGNSIKGLYDAL